MIDSTLSLRSALVLTSLAVVVACALPARAAAPDFETLLGLDVKPRKTSDHAFSPDGSRLAYLWDDGSGKRLELLDVTSGETSVLLTAGAEGAPAAIDELVWAPDGSGLVVVGDGDLFLARPARGETAAELRRLTETESAEEDPKFAPGDARRLAFVRDADLHLLDLESGTERALTTGGEPGSVLHGKTDWVYWEELWGRDSTGYWWSPDGERIAYYRFEEDAVGEFPLLDELPPYPAVERQRYPKAGTTNPTVRIGVLPVAGGETTWLDTGDPAEWYLPRVHWKPDGALAVERLNREQDTLELLDCKPSGACETLIEEKEDTWVRVGDETRFLPDGRILWASDRSGWRHLYLFDSRGELERQLTSGERHVTSVDAVEDGYIVATRYGVGPLGAKDREVVRIGLDEPGTELLTKTPGDHAAIVAPGGEHWVHTFGDANRPPRQVLRKASGEAVAELPSTLGFDPSTLPSWQFFTIDGPDGVELPAARLLPAGFDEGKKYPVIMYHYGGPDSQVVRERWDTRRRGLWHQWMAQRGYVVLMVDNRMSSFFGKQGADRVHRRFGPNNLEAQLAAVEYLRRQPWADAERVGLWGWSGGGSNTLYALLNSPGTWKAGVAGAPVTDWRYYDTIWTERYLDHPDDNAEGYRASSPITYAAELKDPLLIVHGTADDNVHPQNTIAFSKALIDAGIPFEQAIYPGQKHGFGDAAMNHFLRRMTEFFDRHLKGE